MDEITFKLAQFGDEQQAIELFNKLMNDGEHYFTDVYPHDPESLEMYIEDNKKNNLTIIAQKGELFIGWVTVVRKPFKFQHHVGSLLIGVLKEYQGIGLGTTLISHIEKLVNKIQIEKIEILMRKTSKNALNFFLNLGYVMEGEKEKSIKTNYQYENEVVLGKIIS